MEKGSNQKFLIKKLEKMKEKKNQTKIEIDRR